MEKDAIGWYALQVGVPRSFSFGLYSYSHSNVKGFALVRTEMNLCKGSENFMDASQCPTALGTASYEAQICHTKYLNRTLALRVLQILLPTQASRQDGKLQCVITPNIKDTSM